MIHVRSLLACLLVASLSACDGGSEETSDDAFATELTFAEGTKEARAIVAFVDDPATDAAALKAAGITSKSTVAAVLARRNGADGVAATGDDVPFRALGVLDAVKGIGPATLRKLAVFALARGYGIERGFYYGVYFTENQADRTLELVNTASIATLDAETGIDSRALKNIADARPILSMAHLGSLSRVKETAHRLLRERADRDLGAPTCDAQNACESGVMCLGATEFSPGRCVENEEIVGAGDSCSPEGTCGAGLICAGRRDDFEGICNPFWTRDEFVDESSGTLVDVPDSSTRVSVQVTGLATVPTDAIVRVVIDHPRPDDLELTLTNPSESGTTVMVWPRGSGPLPTAPEGIVVFVPGDEVANGLWTLNVLDTVEGEQGMFSLFSLELTSRFD
jgi:hypothetical protein